jgi:hypothetical protein
VLKMYAPVQLVAAAFMLHLGSIGPQSSECQAVLACPCCKNDWHTPACTAVVLYHLLEAFRLVHKPVATLAATPTMRAVQQCLFCGKFVQP